MTSLSKIHIEPLPLVIFEGRHLYRTAKAGEIADGNDRTGETVMRAYPPGAFVLADSDGQVLAGPITPQAAAMLAVDVVSGNQRAATMPGVALRLAIAVIALVTGDLPPVARTGVIVPTEKDQSHA